MSGKIQKYPTDVAMPLTKNKNQLKFNVNQENGQIDMNSSYLELELNIVDSTGAQVTDLNDVVLGRDNIMYGPTCIVRDSKLYGTKSGKKYQELNYVNILMQNLNYWTQGKNEIKANTLWNGMGAKVQDGSVLSIFNNTYQDENPTLRVPLKELYPGSIGNSDMFPADEDLTFTYFLEPYYRILQSLSSSNYVAPVQASAVDPQPDNKNFTSGGQASSVLTPEALGQLVGYAQGQYVSVPAGDVANIFKITNITADAGQTIGSITLDGQVTAGAVTLGTVYPVNMITTAGTVACNDVAGAGAPISSVTVTTQNQAPAVGSKVQVSYYFYVPGMVGTDFTTLQLSSYVTVTNVQAGVVTLSAPIYTSNLSANSKLYGVTIDKLTGQNLDTYDWQVVNAHLVLYRRNVPMVPNKNMLVSNFESMNVQIVPGIDKFFYTFLTDKSCYNAYGFVPTGSNLYSQAQGIGTYQFSVDGKPLTSLYMDTSSSLHEDNMLRALSNSPYYPCKNLNQDRDDEEAPNPTSVNPLMYPAKVYQSMLKGEPVVNSEPGNLNLKLEIVPESGQTTPAGNVYLFCEKYQEL